ncbi:MAG: O-antigen ligase family protein [Clostridiales bacterium]|nr:O-antigen ligase family protein [Clostridiales bacterium]
MKELQKEFYPKKSKIYIGLYIFFIFGAAMGDWKVLNMALGALPKVISVGAIGLAVAYIFWSGNFRNFKILFNFSLMYSSIIVGIILCSTFIWILDLQTIGYIMKGASKISYQFLNILVVLSAVYMFEENAAKYTFFGIAAANFVIILLGAATTGPAGAVRDLIANITSFGASDVIANSNFIRAIEIHDITFVMGVYVLYFLFFCPGEKYRYMYAAVALFLFFAGLKRIAFLSMIAAIMFAIFCSMLGPRGKTRVLILAALFIVGFCYFYIVIIQKGIFTEFCQEHEIELNGREKIYDYISNFYTVSPSYKGKGYEFCVYLLKSMKGTKDMVVNINAVHNDILKMYVELGFWGFFCWIMGYYVYQTYWFNTRCGEKTAVCFMAINVYMLVTYMTDNTMFYYWSSMVIRMIPMSFFFAPVKDFPLRETDPFKMNRVERRIYKKRKRDEIYERNPRMKVQED